MVIGIRIGRDGGKEAVIIMVGTAMRIMSGREVAVGGTDVNRGENECV